MRTKSSNPPSAGEASLGVQTRVHDKLREWIEAPPIQSGISNTMWSLSQKGGGVFSEVSDQMFFIN